MAKDEYYRIKLPKLTFEFMNAEERKQLLIDIWLTITLIGLGLLLLFIVMFIFAWANTSPYY